MKKLFPKCAGTGIQGYLKCVYCAAPTKSKSRLKEEFDSWLYDMERQIRESHENHDFVREEWQIAYKSGFIKCIEIVKNNF